MLAYLVSLSLAFNSALDKSVRTLSQPPLPLIYKVSMPDNARFFSAQRTVSNWRHEALWTLSLSPPAFMQLAATRTKMPPGMSRCVKLNNYWCIKKAGWNGELAADAEGHVAFVSALEGAKVAALLLRRYYMVYKLHSARAIVSRWAPAQCGGSLVTAKAPPVARVASVSRSLAPRGLQNTLRGRWLASHTRGGFKRKGAVVSVRRSVVPDRTLRMMPAPEIAVGMGEKSIPLKPVELGSLTIGKPLASPLTVSPLSSCANDGPRLAAYARNTADGVTATPDDDLALFTEDGQPTLQLAKVMANMASVEIGPLSVRPWLIDEAIATSLRAAIPEVR